jgi:hypothetical protein
MASLISDMNAIKIMTRLSGYGFDSITIPRCRVTIDEAFSYIKIHFVHPYVPMLVSWASKFNVIFWLQCYLLTTKYLLQCYLLTTMIFITMLPQNSVKEISAMLSFDYKIFILLRPYYYHCDPYIKSGVSSASSKWKAYIINKYAEVTTYCWVVALCLYLHPDGRRYLH